jgi:hypothetical protein
VNIEICDDDDILYSSLGIRVNIFEKEPSVKIHTAVLRLYGAKKLTAEDIAASVTRFEGALATRDAELDRIFGSRNSTHEELTVAAFNHDIKADDYAIRLLGMSVDEYYGSLAKLAIVTKTTEWKRVARRRLGLFLSFIMGINIRSRFGPYISYIEECKAALIVRRSENKSSHLPTPPRSK